MLWPSAAWPRRWKKKSKNMYAQRESNPHPEIRSLLFYPLNYGRGYKIFNSNKLWFSPAIQRGARFFSRSLPLAGKIGKASCSPPATLRKWACSPARNVRIAMQAGVAMRAGIRWTTGTGRFKLTDYQLFVKTIFYLPFSIIILRYLANFSNLW